MSQNATTPTRLSALDDTRMVNALMSSITHLKNGSVSLACLYITESWFSMLISQYLEVLVGNFGVLCEKVLVASLDLLQTWKASTSHRIGRN